MADQIPDYHQKKPTRGKRPWDDPEGSIQFFQSEPAHEEPQAEDDE